MPPYLLARGLDPIVGVFTGVFAFYLHETHPRTARSDDERLVPLLKWKYEQYKPGRERELPVPGNKS